MARYAARTVSVRLRRVLHLACLAMLCILLPHAAAMTAIDRAEITVLENGRPPSPPVPASLPFSWDAAQDGVDGKVEIDLSFSIADPDAAHGLFIMRIGNGYAVRLNGVLLDAKGGDGNPYEDHAKQPRFFRIPQGLLRADNRLAVTVYAQAGRRAGMSPPVIGPVDEVTALYEDSYRWLVFGSFALSIVSAMLGILSLLLWLRQRDPLYIYYGAGELLWGLLMSDTLAERTPLPWPAWGIVVLSSYALAGGLMARFALAFVQRDRGVLRRMSDWNCLATVPVISAAFLLRLPDLVSVWLGLTLTVCSIIAIVVIREGARSHELEKRVLAFAILATCATAIRDMIVFRVLPGYGGIPWVRFAWVAFGITLAWIIAERMRRSTQEIATMNQRLAQRLAEREAELAATYAAQAQSSRQQAVVEERHRITRDMHDGLGSQLLGALHLAQNPGTAREAIVDQLRETLDHLKLTVDAMQDIEGDIASLLGALRYRLGARLESAGIRLDWSVDTLPTMTGWTLQQSRDLQMILYEAFSNLLAHAGARNARLCARHDPASGAILIVLEDDGCGFGDVQASRGGQGMANMRQRAERLGASLSIHSAAKGTRITLALPCVAEVT